MKIEELKKAIAEVTEPRRPYGNNRGIQRIFLQYSGGDQHRSAWKPLRTQKCEPDPSMGRQRASKGIFEGEIPDKSRPLLLLAAGTAENGKD